jgi:hypothetical protein
MEPLRNTAPELLGVQEKLIMREPLFHRPEHGTTCQDFEAMTEDDFWETGASGRRSSRAFVIDTVVERYSVPYKGTRETVDFYCPKMAPSLYLLNDTLHQEAQVTRRTTLWRKVEDRWVAVYHQGTPVDEKGDIS